MSERAIWETEKGTFLRIIVKPKSKERVFIAHFSEDEIFVNLRSPAREGKANAELLKRMSKILQVSSSSILLVAGHKSKEKTICVVGLSIEDVTQKIKSS